MAKAVTLDAMIAREDFAAEGADSGSAESVKSLSVETLGPSGLLMALLRKPDFQRETNHWDTNQVVSFLESFLDYELIPSIILWKSSSFVFVIDGGHRLSALRSWIEDDYGDRHISQKYFSNTISKEQKKIAEKTRNIIDERIGKFSTLKSALINQGDYPAKLMQRARNMATRTLDLQWVKGDAEKAESSFFKINTQGTPLDNTEELLLRNRKRSMAIAARSIVRAATGHNYWSKFEPAKRIELETQAKELHGLLFNPEVDRPLKTLDLPLGGGKSPLDALEMLMNLISIATAGSELKNTIESFVEDDTGEATLNVLKQTFRVVSRITGNHGGSLGLHPAVYFYSERGRHMPDLLLGTLMFFKKKMNNNDDIIFKKFTDAREKLETVIIENKSLITQALHTARSQQRTERFAAFLGELLDSITSGKTISETDIVKSIVPKSVSKLLAVDQESTQSKKFSSEAKSAIFIRQALEGSMKCKICGGYLDVSKSASYDHIQRVRDGGSGQSSNGQLTHPYCNTAIKS